MSNPGRPSARFLAVAAMLLAPALLTPAQGAMLAEDFNTVTGTGGGIFLVGSGQSTLVGWDDGIAGETAFGETLVHAHAVMSAQGDPTGGVGGSGAGVLQVSDLNFNMMDEDFDSVTGTGGGIFLLGDGVTSNISATTYDWDEGIGGEAAFFETYQGATLDGYVSAQGLPGADGAGQLVVNGADVPPGGWRAGLSWTIPGFPAEAASILHNGSFDADGYNPPVGGDFEPMYWTIGGDGFWFQGGPSWEGNVYLEGGQAPPLSAPVALKMWGAWWAYAPNDTFVYQDLAAQEGQVWELDCWTHHITSDALTGDNRAEMRVEFYDAGNGLLDWAVAIILDETSPLDTWIDNTPIQIAAPAGTASVRAGVAFVDDDPAVGGGAAFFDDLTFMVISGPPAIDLSQFSLMADIRGEADPNLGEDYGHYQLRLEDVAGNRLAFESAAVANGQWAQIGGALSAAEEQDDTGAPASGVFDPGSAMFTVVVAFDNDRTTTWGTGGTLEVDNLFLPNQFVDGSYYAGMFWDSLPVPLTDDPRDLTLTADIKGSVPGGTYQFRVEGFSHIPPVNEDFSTATGIGGVQLIAPGGTWGDTGDWDTGIEYAHVFAGIDNGVATEPAGGAWVQGTPTDGNPGGAAVLEAHEIALGTNGKWYVGIFWADQGLASEDLSTVEVTADILGDWSGILEDPSYYILRFEDPQGDWIGFDGIVNGSWQSIGGFLSTATASGQGENGDGVFDIDTSATYTVAVVMESASTSDWGGKLYVDNVYLTPPAEPVKVERGRITFDGVADGDFQSVGGLLSDGDSTWPSVGGCFWPGDWGNTNWDRGIEGEEAFAGTYLAEIGSVCIEGDPTCGVGGSGGGRFTWSGVDAAGGYMWLGASWRLELDQMPFDPSQVEIYADVKGTWDPNEGQSPGIITVRFEQYVPWAESRLAFDGIADGTYQTVGGSLDTAYVDGGVIDPNAAMYSMTIIVHGPRTPTWGTGGTVEFDNVRVIDHGVTILEEDFELVYGPTPGFLNDAGDLDSITVTLTMENGAETWGGGGFCEGDLNGDNLVNLSDLAQLLGHYGTTSGATYEDGDMDGDGDVDLSDLAALLGAYGDTCEPAATLTVDNLLFDVAP